MARRVLVVEDDVLNRMFYHDVLVAHGYEVELVSDGAEVIAAAHKFHPDLITMDIQLPNVSGVELIRQLQASGRLRQIPVLAITAFAGHAEESRIRVAGAKGYLSKPVTVANLISELDRISSEA